MPITVLFAVLAGPPRWVPGKGVHLWHPPVHQNHSPERLQQTQANAARYVQLTRMTPDALREWLTGHSP